MISRVWFINGILAIALILCGVKIWDVWHGAPPVFSEKAALEDPDKTKSPKKILEMRLSDSGSYQNVVDKNLFSPDRAPGPPETTVAEAPIAEEVAVSGEKIVLYGVVMLDGYKRAMINDPVDRSKDFKWVAEGEMIGNLSVREIQEDNILLVDAAKTYRILLYDPEKAAKAVAQSSGKNQPAQPQVISAGEKPPVEAKSQAVSAGEKPPVSVKNTEKSEKYQEKVTLSADGQYEIIETPLGQIKRKRK